MEWNCIRYDRYVRTNEAKIAVDFELTKLSISISRNIGTTQHLHSFVSIINLHEVFCNVLVAWRENTRVVQVHCNRRSKPILVALLLCVVCRSILHYSSSCDRFAISIACRREVFFVWFLAGSRLARTTMYFQIHLRTASIFKKRSCQSKTFSSDCF